VHKAKQINVSNMEAENVVANLIVKQVHKVNQINVSHMEVEKDVANLIVKQVHKVKLINVKDMEAVSVVLIALIGSIPVLVQKYMMDIVQLVSSIFFLMMNRYKSQSDLYLLSLYMTMSYIN
jgi:hypothetical protein